MSERGRPAANLLRSGGTDTSEEQASEQEWPLDTATCGFCGQAWPESGVEQAEPLAVRQWRTITHGNPRSGWFDVDTDEKLDELKSRGNEVRRLFTHPPASDERLRAALGVLVGWPEKLVSLVDEGDHEAIEGILLALANDIPIALTDPPETESDG